MKVNFINIYFQKLFIFMLESLKDLKIRMTSILGFTFIFWQAQNGYCSKLSCKIAKCFLFYMLTNHKTSELCIPVIYVMTKIFTLWIFVLQNLLFQDTPLQQLVIQATEKSPSDRPEAAELLTYPLFKTRMVVSKDTIQLRWGFLEFIAT